MISLRPAQKSDLDALERLENLVFDGDRLSRKSLAYYISNPRSTMLVATLHNRLAAYALLACRKGSKIARLYSIATDPDFYGQGIGNQLMHAIEDAARARGAATLELEVRKDNTAAIKMYQKHGYMHFDDYEDFYEDGMDAMRFRKPLIQICPNENGQ